MHARTMPITAADAVDAAVVVGQPAGPSGQRKTGHLARTVVAKKRNRIEETREAEGEGVGAVAPGLLERLTPNIQPPGCPLVADDTRPDDVGRRSALLLDVLAVAPDDPVVA
jgi:hypothetical protein